MKKLGTIAGTLALFAATVLPALGAGNNCTQSTTGPFSSDYCTITNSSNVSVRNVNDAQIVNTVNASANTGNNSASYNTLGGAITTGNATLNATISNVANVNTTTVNGGPAASSNTGVNEITGPYSDNRINLLNSMDMNVDNDNTASVNNRIDVGSNTGGNAADYNTGPATVQTGDAWTNLGLLNHVNDSATAVSAGAGGEGGNTAENSTTGPFSTNYVDILNNAAVGVRNVNDLQVQNLVSALSNSGFNSASYNTLGGDIGTGDASTGVGVETVGNVNTTTVELAMGGFANAGGTSVSGPFSDNRETILNNQNIVVENWNNKCQSHNADRLGDEECDPEDLGVINKDVDYASTGENASDYNTGGGGAATGFASLWKELVTRLNDTLTVIKN